MTVLWSDIERFGSLFDPWREFERLNRTLRGAAPATSADFPAVNVWVNADNAVVTTEIAGINAEDIDISLTGKTLTLRGSRTAADLGKGEAYHRRERWYGNFSKTIELPFTVDSNKVQARYVNGVLYIALPRVEAEKPKKITVKSS